MNVEMPIVVLVGTPYERGFAHGSRFRTEIAAILDRDFRRLSEQERSQARGRADAAYEAIRAVSPQVAAELAGIAEGSGRTVSDVVLRSGFELLMPLSELLKPTSDTGCSALAVKTKTGSIAAQNWDGLPFKNSDLALFLHFSQGGFEFAVVGSYGGLGNVGMNKSGLALVNNDLVLRTSRVGIPSQVVRRLILEMPDVKHAADRIASLQHIGGRCYLLADRTGEITAVEVSATSGANFLPPAEVLLHTNNALLPATSEEEDRDTLLNIYPSSAGRLAALQAAVAREALGVDGVKRVLSDELGAPNAVCKTASASEPTETAFSIVMDCVRGELHLAAGRPSVNAYRKVSLPINSGV